MGVKNEIMSMAGYRVQVSREKSACVVRKVHVVQNDVLAQK